MWDVANELASDSDQEIFRQSPVFRTAGLEVVDLAFRTAHAADPAAVLYLADYNIVIPHKRANVLRIVDELLAKGTPLHGVALQGHWGLNFPADLNEIQIAIDEIVSRGLRVSVSELDISVLPQKYFTADVSIQQAREEGLDPYMDGILPDEVQRQLTQRYVDLFTVFLKNHQHIDHITMWGLDDGSSWKNNYPIRQRTDFPLLFDRSYQPKPAVAALIAAAQEFTAAQP